MSAVAMTEVAETFARTVDRLAHSDVIDVAQTEFVDDKAASTDLAGEFSHGVVSGLIAQGNAKDSDAV